ncbi:MAG TPA: diadenylate cyclase CdaA [Candidatus Limnocylindria bacterium]|nr:diadenylate cyclase CdaA [Candidatus Limnocylindria bacterium]
MGQLLDLVNGFEVQPVAILDILLTALLIYGLFSLVRGTRAVRLIIGVSVLYAIYVLAQALGLQLLTQIMQAGAVVGLLALVIVFQPELRRALERIGRVGSLGWLVAPSAGRSVERVASVVARGAAALSAQRVGALIVLERETGLQDAAEAGVIIDSELTPELLATIFTPHSPLHDGAVLVRGERIVAAAVVLPLSETSLYRERFGTRHRAALGITEQTDALAVVVSEETGSIGLVERGRIVRNLDEDRLRSALSALLGNRRGGRRLPAQAQALRRGMPLRGRASSRRHAEPAPAPEPAGASGTQGTAGAAAATHAATTPGSGSE